MHYSPLEEVNESLSARRQEFVLRRQSGIAAPMFPLNRYYAVNNQHEQDNNTQTCKEEVKQIDSLGARHFKINLRCDDSFSTLQNHSYFDESTLVNSTMDTVATPDLVPQILSPVPFKPVLTQYLMPIEHYSKKRLNESIDAPSPKRQTTGHFHYPKFISSDIISSDPFGPICLNEKEEEKKEIQNFPYFNGKQISKLTQSSFDPIFSED